MREVVEVEAEFGRDVGVGELLVRQADVEADGIRAGVERAAIGGLHDAGAAAGHDQRLSVAGSALAAADHPAEFARHVVVAAVGEDTLGDREPSRVFAVAVPLGTRGREAPPRGEAPRWARRCACCRTRRWCAHVVGAQARSRASDNPSAAAGRARDRWPESRSLRWRACTTGNSRIARTRAAAAGSSSRGFGSGDGRGLRLSNGSAGCGTVRLGPLVMVWLSSGFRTVRQLEAAARGVVNAASARGAHAGWSAGTDRRRSCRIGRPALRAARRR